MAVTLRASDNGLKTVDKLRTKKGWSRREKAWYELAYTSESTLRRFWKKQPISHENFVKICTVIEANWEDIVDESHIPVRAQQCRISTFALPEKIAPVRNWVGRSKELETLKSHLLDPVTRTLVITAVCVVGLAGIGKTTLVAHLLRQLHSENAPFSVAAWESLRSTTDTPRQFNKIVNSLLFALSNGKITQAVTILEDDRQKTERLMQLLKEQPCLLVLDDVETVLTIKQAKRAGYVADICAEYGWLFKQLASAEHQSKVIFASRETIADLQRPETRTLPLGGLDLEAAVTLLQAFELTATPEELAALATRYEGHPKALEVVAALIRDDAEFQGSVCKFLADRNWLLVNTLNALIEEVTNRLSLEELTCLSQISVYETQIYPLSFTGIAAQLPQINKRDVRENIIEALKRRQLLDYNPDKQSYQMHPLVQEKASEFLKPELYRIAHRLASGYFLINTKPESEWKTTQDIQAFLRAHHHSVQAQDWDEAAAINSRLYEHLQRWGDFDLILDLDSKLIPENWKEGGQLVTSPHVHSDILLRLGIANHHKGKLKLAQEYLEKSLSVSRQVSDLSREANALCYLGQNYEALGDYDTALQQLESCLDIAKALKNDKIKYKALDYMGTTYLSQGEYNLALKAFNESLQITRLNDFIEEESLALGNLGSTYNMMGNTELAIDFVKQQLEIGSRIGSQPVKSYALASLATIYSSIQEYNLAIWAANELLKITEETGDKTRENHARFILGRVQRLLGNYQESIPFFEQSLKISREVGYQLGEANILLNLAMSYRELGDFKASVENNQKSLMIYRGLGATSQEARGLLELAKTSFKIKTVSQATTQEYLDRAEKICLDLNLPLLTEVQKIKANLPEIASKYK